MITIWVGYHKLYRKVKMDTITLNPTQYLMLVIACYCAGWLSYWIADIVKKKGNNI